MTQRPNILWICTDQQRFDTIGALGNSLIQTPCLDQLVAEGVTFLSAYCQSTVCTPSRASFLTGRYPRTTRCRQNGQTIPPTEKLISRLFADSGYACGLAGKQHLSSCSDGKVEIRSDDGYAEFHWSHHPQPDWPENAYTQWLSANGTSWEEIYTGQGTPYVKVGVPAELHQTTWCAEKAIEFIRAQKDHPWFFSFNCFDPHHPFDPPPEYLSRFDASILPLPKGREGELEQKTSYQRLDSVWAHNTPGDFHVAAMTDQDKREVVAAYYAMVELIDAQVGRMLQALEETGQSNNTIVIFMSDHGEMLGDHGLYYKGPHFYEEAVKVPLILRWPHQFQAGSKVSGLVELIDLAPTLLEACGQPVPEAMQGESLLRHCRGGTNPDEHTSYVYCEYLNAWTHPGAYGTMMRTKDKKIVVYHGVDEGELYDLSEDPDELYNLWDQTEHQGLRHQLLKAAFDASVFTMDPMPPRLGPF